MTTINMTASNNAIISLAYALFNANQTGDGSEQPAQMRKDVSDADLSLAKQCSVG